MRSGTRRVRAAEGGSGGRDSILTALPSFTRPLSHSRGDLRLIPLTKAMKEALGVEKKNMRRFSIRFNIATAHVDLPTPTHVPHLTTLPIKARPRRPRRSHKLTTAMSPHAPSFKPAHLFKHPRPRSISKGRAYLTSRPR
ncbi:hypothetical protein E2C01_053035 [Portunus trituberculatus]|uniref:Uncharacterized protein n=1 Tax=Portunus trituberculatus TaxID=210409 RepID=A0A5B7GFC8_PORTR|nr:hypothetical protein [Portunus trituberculatus]